MRQYGLASPKEAHRTEGRAGPEATEGAKGAEAAEAATLPEAPDSARVCSLLARRLIQILTCVDSRPSVAESKAEG